MNPTQRTYIAIDLKSFFASVECVERGLDPLTTNLVVADASRTEKTICLAVTPSLKAHGVGGRARLFEVVQRVREVNRQRWYRSFSHRLSGKSCDARALEQHPDWEVDYIVAPPRMAYYIEYSRRIYEIYLKYIAPEDIHVYSIDEVFIDGKGIAERLAPYGIDTMGKIARCSLENEDLLYRLFGMNAELLIDHAWGWEPCTMQAVKAYRPETNSFSTGQVFQCAYDFRKARVVIREMADAAALDLVSKRMVTDQLVMTVGYDIECLTDPAIRCRYHGPITTDAYGREVPKSAHGTTNLPCQTASSKLISEAVVGLFDQIVQPDLLIRRLNLSINHVVAESEKKVLQPQPVQLDLFTDYNVEEARQAEQSAQLAKERRIQETLLTIKQKYGKNAILRGLNFEEGATAVERNKQIGGHKA